MRFLCIRDFILVGLFGFSIVSQAFAAEGEIELQFVSFPKNIEAAPVDLLIGDGKTMRVEMPTNRISPVYRVKPLGKWVIGKTKVDEKGKPSFDVYGQTPSINLPKQLILVIRKGLNDTDGLELIPMANDEDNFGGGSYFFMNASTVDIAAKIGSSEFSLGPKKSIMIKPEPSAVKEDRKYLYTYFYFKKGDIIRPFYSSTWRYNNTVRCMVFIYHDPYTKQLRKHTIRDYMD